MSLPRRWSFALLGLALCLVAAGWVADQFWGGHPESGATALFVVAEGASLRSVAEDLADSGLIRHPWSLRVLARIRGQERLVRSGEYELQSGQSVAATLEALVAGPVLTRAITLLEGWTREQTVDALSSGLGIEREDLDSLSASPPAEWREKLELPEGMTLEGYLFPDTWRFARGVSARRVLGTLVEGFGRAFDDSMRTAARARGMSVHQVVTLASIVEAEAVIDAERPKVAAVYLNRMQRGWKLEADPTVAYALGKLGERLTFRDLEVDSAYNTYRNPGLPPGPINSPGLASMRAVLWPEPDFQAMYFVADGKGGHRFTRTWEEHQAAVRQYRAHQRRTRAGG